MSPFDCAWLVMKAPLDLDSVQELDGDYLSAMEERAAMLRSLLEANYRTSQRDITGDIPYQDRSKLIEELSALEHIIRKFRGAHGNTIYRANHYDTEGTKFPMIAYPQGDGGGEVEAYFGGKGRGPIGEIGRPGQGVLIGGDRWFYPDSIPHQVGSLMVSAAGYGDRGRLVEGIISERMGLPENPFDAWIRAENYPEEYTDEELDEIDANYEEACNMLHEYSEGSLLDVRASHQRKGIGTAMRDFLSELNDNYLPDDLKVDLRPDPNQSFDAQRLWAANQNDPWYRDRLHEIWWRGLRERMGDEQ